MSESMKSDGRMWQGTIPAKYTDSAFPLQYYFELTEGPESAALYPGLGVRRALPVVGDVRRMHDAALLEQRTGQPYFDVRRG